MIVPHCLNYVGKLLERGSFTELIDQSLLNNASDDNLRLQMEAFGKLALRCVRFSQEENVPRTIVVAREVKEIETYTQNFSRRCFFLFFSFIFLLLSYSATVIVFMNLSSTIQK